MKAQHNDAKLAKRPAQSAVITTALFQPSRLLARDHVGEGTKVVLRSGKDSSLHIAATVVGHKEGRYIATINGFDACDRREWDGMKLGESIEFGHDSIIASAN